jgi:RHS repeat-associated protein
VKRRRSVTHIAVRKYAYGRYVDDRLLYIERSAAGDAGSGVDEKLYVHTDRRFSVTALTNATGGVAERYSYTPYGEIAVFDGAGVVRGGSLYGLSVAYTGRKLDRESALYFFRARYHDPRLGRFTTRDPLFYPDGPNAYAGWIFSGTEATETDRSKNWITVRRVGKSSLSPDCPNPVAFVNFQFVLSPPKKWPCRGGLGVFIQKVDVECTQCSCGFAESSCKTESSSYWEMFADISKSDESWHTKDTVKFDSYGPRGTYRQTGEVRFICIAPEGQAPGDGEMSEDEYRDMKGRPKGEVPNTCKTSTIALPYVTSEPTYWSRNTIVTPGKRDFFMNWDCCCKNPTAAAKAKP